MPKVQPKHIVTFSSEDPNHPASNLLNADTFRKWKCKQPGEPEVFVVIKLEKAEKILSVDIGNESSAFVEILVGRSGGGGGGDIQKFDVLQSSAVLMSPAESKSVSFPNRTKMFMDSLNKVTASQKWDLIKVVCTQPFNRTVQYGLSFINIISHAEPSEAKKIGGFQVRAGSGNIEDSESIRIGSSFVKYLESTQQQLKAKPLSGIIQQSQTDVALQQTNFSPSAEIRGKSMSLGCCLADTEKISNQTNCKKRKASPASAVECRSKNSNANSETPTRKNPPVLKSPADDIPMEKALFKVTRKRYFSHLFSDVVFAISGYPNPCRSELRRKAIEMGGRYKQDWDSTCTHLICAFVNTPKFVEVKAHGNGKIVSKAWVEDSYFKRRRFPWRRYCLDGRDSGPESEDEIIAGGTSSESESDADIDVQERRSDFKHASTDLAERGKQNAGTSKTFLNHSRRVSAGPFESSSSSSENEEDWESKSQAAYDAETDIEDVDNITSEGD